MGAQKEKGTQGTDRTKFLPGRTVEARKQILRIHTPRTVRVHTTWLLALYSNSLH